MATLTQPPTRVLVRAMSRTFCTPKGGELIINAPKIIAEVRQRFEDYEHALEVNDVAALDAAFWRSPLTVRLARSEHGYGWDQIHAHRLARPAGFNSKERRLKTTITSFGEDNAYVNLVYKIRGQDRVGRQTQHWARIPGEGWKVTNAHVSLYEGPLTDVADE
mmetsp:Transcript_6460/g.12533  ORF Transcript_6460/g.12533 Transcript_6460/m.12533 type:complete len:163 (+) Transcript_6460:49-537(+)